MGSILDFNKGGMTDGEHTVGEGRMVSRVETNWREGRVIRRV